MTTHCKRILIFAIPFIVALASPVLAQTSRDAYSVRSGQSVVLAMESSLPIVVTTDAMRGKTTISETLGGAKQFTLLYTAPESETTFTETVSFSNPTPHLAEVTVVPGPENIYQHIFRSLFVLFVLSLILESGLAVLFQWRPFVVYFDGRGVRTVVSVAFALLFVSTFEMDIVTDLVNVYGQRRIPSPHNLEGYIITALVVAGGSGAVNNLLVGLGFRSVLTSAQLTPRPPKTEGWISVTLIRKQAQGPVDVLIGAPPIHPATQPPIAGTITGCSRLSKFVRLFIRDTSRFPMSGGFAVPAGSLCQVQLKGIATSGQPVVSQVWGPETIASSAIIDLELTL